MENSLNICSFSKNIAIGVEKFFHFNATNTGDVNEIQCPCMKYENIEFHTIKDVIGHMYWNRFDANNQKWISHGDAHSLRHRKWQYLCIKCHKFETIQSKSIPFCDTFN